MEPTTFERQATNATPASLSESTPDSNPPRDSAAIRRLMEEVRLEETHGSPLGSAYDRAHNRHNR